MIYASWVKDDAARAKYIEAFERSDFEAMLKDVQVIELFIYRDSDRGNYPNGCELTLTSSHDPSRTMKVSILGDPFKNLQKIILATIGFEDADEIE